jgi:hypothetical protein
MSQSINYKQKFLKYNNKNYNQANNNNIINLNNTYTFIGRSVHDFPNEIELIKSNNCKLRSGSILGNHELLYGIVGYILHYDENIIRDKLCDNVYCKYDCATSLSDAKSTNNFYTQHESCQNIIPRMNLNYYAKTNTKNIYESFNEMISNRNVNFEDDLDIWKSNLYNEIIIKNIQIENIKYLYISIYNLSKLYYYFVGYNQLYVKLINMQKAQKLFYDMFSIILPIVIYDNQQNKLIKINDNLINIKPMTNMNNMNSENYIYYSILGLEKLKQYSYNLIRFNEHSIKIDEEIDYCIVYLSITEKIKPSSYLKLDFDFFYKLDFSLFNFTVSDEFAKKLEINKNEYCQIKTKELDDFLNTPFVFYNYIYKTIDNPDMDDPNPYISNPDYSEEENVRREMEDRRIWEEKINFYKEEKKKKTYEDYNNILRDIFVKKYVDNDKIKLKIKILQNLMSLHNIKMSTNTDIIFNEIEKLSTTEYYSKLKNSNEPNKIAENILYGKSMEFNESVFGFIKNCIQ